VGTIVLVYTVLPDYNSVCRDLTQYLRTRREAQLYRSNKHFALILFPPEYHFVYHNFT